MRHLAACATTFALVASAAVGVAAASTDPWSDPSVLRAGHALVAGSAHNALRTPDQRFMLSVIPSQVSIDEWDRVTARKGRDDNVWAHMAPPAAYRSADRTSLRLQRNGNLVLRAGSGRVLWSSHTAGTGSANYVQLLPTGNLVMRTSTGRTVWQTRTTATALVHGDRLAADHSLVNRRFGTPTWLTMTSGGDLVLRKGAHRIWHSNTHRAGSYAALRADGSLEVVGPAGNVRWHSRTIGSEVAAVLTNGRVLIEYAPQHGCVRIPAGVGSSCQPG